MTRILIVDDDRWICDVLSRVLEKSHYQVCTARSAEDALYLLKTQPFDLMVTDVMMPGMSGIDLITQALSQYPHIPVVLITGQSDAETMREALRLGAVDFIPKPFTVETVPLIIERNLERRSLEQARALERQNSMQVATVQALAAAIDAKEPFTAQHSRRVAELAKRLAVSLCLSADEAQLLELAALVHDVGKIGVPDTILNKPEKLDEPEWAIMRQHPTTGEEIVGRMPELTYVAEIVRHHHERIDGSGYPDALQGEAIPYLSRIIAVVDAYEVMTSARVYKPRLMHEVALSRLQESAGTQFDAAVVTAFIAANPAEPILLT